MLLDEVLIHHHIATCRLCGFPPFAEDENGLESVYLKIRSGALEFPHPYWTNVSEEGTYLR